MSDLIERLLDLAGLIHPVDRPTIYQSADEIERLTAERDIAEGLLKVSWARVEALERIITENADIHCEEIAREALKDD